MLRPTASHLVFLRDRESADSPAWNMASYLLFDRLLPRELLEDGLNAITAENDALRLRPVWGADDVSFEIDPFAPRRFGYERFETEERFLAWAEERIDEAVFRQPGMWTAFIIEVGEKSGVLNIGHHAMSDGYNVVVLYEKLRRYVAGETPEGQSYLQHLQEDEKYRGSNRFIKDRQFWEDRLSEPFQTVFFDQLPPTADRRCVNRQIELPQDSVRRLEEFCAGRGIPESVLIYSAAALTVHYLSGADRFSLGVPVLGRSTNREMQALGLFMNIVPLIAEVGDTDFLTFLQQTEEKLFDLFRHQRFSVYDISRCGDRPETRGALYEITVDYTDYRTDPSYESRVLYPRYSPMPMELHFLKDREHALSYTLRCREAVADDPLAAQFPDVFSTILNAVAEDPEAGIRSTWFLPADARQKVLYTFNDTGAPYEKEKSVYELFAEQAAKGEQGGSIREENARYSLRQLDADATRVDAFVRETVGSEKQVIGILCDRSYYELAAIFGVVRGGSAYLPISPKDPPERIRAILSSGGCRLALAQAKYAHLADCARSIEDILEMPFPEDAPAPAAKPGDTLYAIYTSGSTGTPKGAMVSNRSAVNRIQWMAKRYFDASTVVMRKTPYTFDVSVWEIFGFAVAGFSLYILPPELHYKQNDVLAHIEKGRVTDLHFVPTVFEQFLSVLEAAPDARRMLRSVRRVILSGESLPAKAVNTFFRYHDGRITLHNLYGPAECAVDATAYDCADAETDPIPIGRPIANTQIYIVDPYLRPLPIGVTGELCIAGDGVGQGYLNRPELTAERFVDNPFGAGKLYRTGDLARWREDGNLIFIGRNDFQVKINGQRVEPGEIEAALSALDGVESAAVVAREDEAGRRTLCAYYTGDRREPQTLRSDLLRSLPRYMVPQSFTHLDAMPQTSSGKTDRTSLLKNEPARPDGEAGFEPPANETEAQICRAFCRVLHIDAVGRNDHFYDIGGTSLDMVRLLCEAPLSALSAAEFMEDPTPRALGLRLSARRTETTCLSPLYLPQEAEKAVVLFPYAGGDASAYTALAAECRRRKLPVALWFVPWLPEEAYAQAAGEIARLAGTVPVRFYSHCAGSSIALKLLELLNKERRVVSSYIAGADLPPRGRALSRSPWRLLSDRQLLATLLRAKFPGEDLPSAEIAAFISRFRENTDAYFSYFSGRRSPQDCPLTVVLCKKDPFTRSRGSAKRRWEKYAGPVRRVVLLEGDSHYFQSERPDVLIGLFLER